ncbi:CLUMA_CG003982, isoform A [Clunio marinus]|uniref:CLUMA_CG003982, isoform A n=1 Tax=Clunio marinus TaxID=568069 RepID=A0A1J1HQF0_9DIPT|nr:CLUMA_CG003982, isoform A [Clunio marinus]
MKTFVSTLIVLNSISSIICFPKFDETTLISVDDEVKVDESLIEKINFALDDFKRLERNVKFRNRKQLFPFVPQAIDKQCVLNRYKKLNISDKIPSKTSGKNIYEPTMTIFVFMRKICSKNLDKYLRHTFESVMSDHFKLDLKAFIEDPQVLELLTCTNYFAVRNGIIDPSVYKINYNLSSSEAEAECLSRNLGNSNHLFKMMKSDFPEISKKLLGPEILKEIDFFFLKNFLLLQVEMTFEQKQHEMKNYVSGGRKIIEDVLMTLAESQNN